MIIGAGQMKRFHLKNSERWIPSLTVLGCRSCERQSRCPGDSWEWCHLGALTTKVPRSNDQSKQAEMTSRISTGASRTKWNHWATKNTCFGRWYKGKGFCFFFVDIESMHIERVTFWKPIWTKLYHGMACCRRLQGTNCKGTQASPRHHIKPLHLWTPARGGLWNMCSKSRDFAKSFRGIMCIYNMYNIYIYNIRYQKIQNKKHHASPSLKQPRCIYSKPKEIAGKIDFENFQGHSAKCVLVLVWDSNVKNFALSATRNKHFDSF